jgi:hypothetical protein
VSSRRAGFIGGIVSGQSRAEAYRLICIGTANAYEAKTRWLTTSASCRRAESQPHPRVKPSREIRVLSGGLSDEAERLRNSKVDSSLTFEKSARTPILCCRSDATRAGSNEHHSQVYFDTNRMIRVIRRSRCRGAPMLGDTVPATWSGAGPLDMLARGSQLRPHLADVRAQLLRDAGESGAERTWAGSAPLNALVACSSS